MSRKPAAPSGSHGGACACRRSGEPHALAAGARSRAAARRSFSSHRRPHRRSATANAAAPGSCSCRCRCRCCSPQPRQMLRQASSATIASATSTAPASGHSRDRRAPHSPLAYPCRRSIRCEKVQNLAAGRSCLVSAPLAGLSSHRAVQIFRGPSCHSFCRYSAPLASRRRRCDGPRHRCSVPYVSS